MPERWRPVVGYEGRYEVSDQGRMRALFPHNGATPPRLVGHPGGRGYMQVALRKDGTEVRRYVHELVLVAFVGSRPAGGCIECRHLDGNRSNNVLANLCWGTKLENSADVVRHGTRACGERHGAAKLTEAAVRDIRQRAGIAKQAALAQQYGVGQAIISDVIHRKRWAHVE